MKSKLSYVNNKMTQHLLIPNGVEIRVGALPGVTDVNALRKFYMSFTVVVQG